MGDVVFTFGREISEGRFYVTIEGPDDTFDVKSEVRPSRWTAGSSCRRRARHRQKGRPA